MRLRKRTSRHTWWLGLWFAIALAFQAGLAAQFIHRLLLHSHGVHADAVDWIFTFVLMFVTPLLCLGLGFYTAYQRTWDRRAWLLLLLLISYALFVIGTDTVDAVMSWPPVIRSLALIYRTFWFYSWPVWMILFAVYFPERAGVDRRWPWLKWMVLTPVGALGALYMVIRVMRNEGMPQPRILQAIEPAMSWLMQDLLWFTVAVCVGLWVARISKTSGPDARRRLRILFFGLAISFVPVILADLIGIQIVGLQWSDFPRWIALLAALPLALFPVTLAYVTVVERALEVGVLIRQSLQYALARRGVLAMRIVVSTGVVLMVALLSGGLPLGLRMVLTAGGIWLVLLVGVGSESAARWIDRRFFREAYNVEQVLQQLAEQVTSIVELKPLLETVTHRLADALHITRLAIFLNDKNHYRPAAVLGFSELPAYAFMGGADTVEQLRMARKPLPVYLDEPGSWTQQIKDSESNVLRELETQLLVPIARRSEMLGFLSFGPKISEAPYSPSDLQLLQSVASQTGFAIENSRLSSAMASEIAEREVLNRELAIAREVQQRLFPQERPSIAGVDLVGVCRPAREVGGDYYDFFALAGDVLGLAVGDVSGKGVPASLLMASLQASLRGQILAGAANIDQLVANVNSLVYGTSSVNRYATFFYAQYSPLQRLLTYVNAGHNPPVLLRKHSTVVRLEAGGLPVGLLPAARYEGASIDIEAGDLLLLFSDGISEAMNEQEEEWGEENMLCTLKACSSMEPAGIVKALFEAADAFTGRAPQHDDMTLVVARFST
ncbi:MAG TPA: GAF domain-containing SpoIIE family protein phosphatase [Bryobacteraceae bacterium]